MQAARLAVITLVVLAACGGSDDDATESTSADGTGDTGTAAPAVVTDATAPSTTVATEPDLPVECATTLDLTMSAVPDAASVWEAAGVGATATPIVPNGDGSLDDLTPQEFNDLGAESELLVYTQWVGDHPFDQRDIGTFSGPDSPAGAITVALSVVPTSNEGLEAGQTISDDDEFAFDTITTFGPAGVYLQGGEGIETWFLVDNMDETQGSTAEILYVDDSWLCVDWLLRGETRDPDGTYEISGVVVSEFERLTTPFT